MTIYRASQVSEPTLIRYAQQMAERCAVAVILCLEGDLGAGKSTFARGWIRSATGEVDVPSPTFSLMQEYRDLDRDAPLYHMDLYRLKSSAELAELGFEEMLNTGTCLIDWVSKVPEALPAMSVPMAVLRLDFEATDTRAIRLETDSDFWCTLAESLGWERTSA